MKYLSVVCIFLVLLGFACCSMPGGWSDGNLGDSATQSVSTYAVSHAAENGAECAEAYTAKGVQQQVSDVVI